MIVGTYWILITYPELFYEVGTIISIWQEKNWGTEWLNNFPRSHSLISSWDGIQIQSVFPQGLCFYPIYNKAFQSLISAL